MGWSTWTTRTEELADGRGLRCSVDRDSRAATFLDVIHAWQDDTAFRSHFNDHLAVLPFSAFRWESPPVTAATISRPFEFVVLDSPGLARRPDPAAFAEHFDDASRAAVTSFRNLGGDAIMVVPYPKATASANGHLAAFVRHGPEFQRDELWRVVGMTMSERLGLNFTVSLRPQLILESWLDFT
jgi:hypothetical protein